MGALRRLEQLIQEAVVTVPRALIAETIDLIVFETVLRNPFLQSFGHLTNSKPKVEQFYYAASCPLFTGTLMTIARWRTMALSSAAGRSRPWNVIVPVVFQ